MTAITVMVPTRDRPDNAWRLLQSMDATSVLDATKVCLVLDRNSPKLPEYVKLVKPLGPGLIPYIGVGNMVERTNAAALTLAPHCDILGWAADDNLFVTEHWDFMVAAAFADPSVLMVNTNDLLVGDSKAGACFIRSDVVQALGYFYLPTCQHLYVDLAVNELFKAAGAQRYREDIVIEHLHPYAGKAEWDEAYQSYNTPMQDSHDGRAYMQWRDQGGFAADVEKLRTIRP